MENTSSTLTTTFDCDGTPITVSTEQMDGESFEDFVARHEARVAQAMKDCDDGNGSS